MYYKNAKACCGFGHREIFENIEDRLNIAISDAITNGCTVFYTGAMGKFDDMFSLSVRTHKKQFPNIKLICVKPYMTKEINECGEYLYSLYDDIIIPTELADVHYKSVIKMRNRLLIDYSDVIISYVIRNYGGACDALKYAEKNKKQVIKLNRV